ncbi:hypothetical protein [Pinisolibacter sp.]|uniref:hypothetical protein n=1 Tax=Pinisolibacter sp. TaxID=2172024 RepID=UPI002FDCDF6B
MSLRFTLSRLGGRLAAVAVALLWLAAPAEARNDYSLDRDVDNVRGWRIAANEARRGCLAVASYHETCARIALDDRLLT